MKKLMALLFFTSSLLNAQKVFEYQNSFGSVDINLLKLSQTDEYTQYNDIWGYVGKDGLEYAILGTTTGTAIYSLKDPRKPKRDTFIPGNTSIWRDMKSFKNHVYVTADQGNQGVLIINMTQAPNKITFKYSRLPAPTPVNPGNVGNCHNLWIDEKGFMYLSGCSPQSGGVLIYDLNGNPEEPVYVGAAEATYSHDNYVRNDTLYSAEIYAGNFSIYHIKDKKNITKLASQPTTTRFTHNVWLSDDHQFLFTTDEKPQGKVDAYSIKNPEKIKLLHSFRPPVLQNLNSLPHNTHFIKNAKGKFIVTSWYDEGVSVADVSDPENMVEIAIGRTTKGGNGCWGAYPFLPSGLILASDMDNGLFIYEPHYTAASKFDGVILDAANNNPVPGARIILEGNPRRETESDGFGRFKTGTPETGQVKVTISKNGFESKTLFLPFSESLALKNVTIYISKLPTSRIQGQILSKENGNPIPKASIGLFSNQELIHNGEASPEGFFTLSEIIASKYYFSAAKWGYQSLPFKEISIPIDLPLVEKLTMGYQDPFNFNLGWSSTHTATTGKWERGVPIGTSFNGVTVAPAADSPNDEGNFAYLTGNVGGDASVGDVDNGITILHSPNISVATNAKLNLIFDVWYFNGGGNSVPDDTLFVYATNGLGDSVLIYRHFENTRNWTTITIHDLEKKIKPGLFNKIHFIIGDLSTSPHRVEAGMDNFKVEQMIQTGVSNKVKRKAFAVYPNPGSNQVSIQFFKEESFTNGKISMFHQNGVLMEHKIVENQEIIHMGKTAPPGLYLLLWQDDHGFTQVEKWLKTE